MGSMARIHGDPGAIAEATAQLRWRFVAGRRPGRYRGGHRPATNRHRILIGGEEDLHEEGWLRLGHTDFHIAGLTRKRALPRLVNEDRYSSARSIVLDGSKPIRVDIGHSRSLPGPVIGKRRGTGEGAGVSRFLHLLLLVAQVPDINT